MIIVSSFNFNRSCCISRRCRTYFYFNWSDNLNFFRKIEVYISARSKRIFHRLFHCYRYCKISLLCILNISGNDRRNFFYRRKFYCFITICCNNKIVGIGYHCYIVSISISIFFTRHTCQRYCDISCSGISADIDSRCDCQNLTYLIRICIYCKCNIYNSCIISMNVNIISSNWIIN